MRKLATFLVPLFAALFLLGATAATAPPAAAYGGAQSNVPVEYLAYGYCSNEVKSYEAIYNVWAAWLNYAPGITVDGCYGHDDEWATYAWDQNEGLPPRVDTTLATWASLDRGQYGYLGGTCCFHTMPELDPGYSAEAVYTIATLYNTWVAPYFHVQSMAYSNTFDAAKQLQIAWYQQRIQGSGNGVVGPTTWWWLFQGYIG